MRAWLPLSILLAGCGAGTDTDVPAVVVTNVDTVGRFDVVVDTTTFDLGDRGGFASTVNTRVHYPRNRTTPDPVVILSPGFAVRAEQYNDSANRIASWGFVVLVPQYDNGIPTARTHVELAADTRALIDALATQPLPEEVFADVNTVALVGHSRGGKQSIHAAALDDRPVAVVGWDPVDSAPPFGSSDPADYPSVAPELMGDITAPLMILGMARGAQGAVACAPEGDNHASYADAAPEGTVYQVLPATGHNDVIDDCTNDRGGLQCDACVAGDDPQLTVRYMRAATLSFLGGTVKGDEGMGNWLASDAAAELLAELSALEGDTGADTDAE